MERTEIQVIMRSTKKGYFAHGVFDGSGLTVLKGSKVCEDVRSSYRDSQAFTRANYIGADGITLKDLYFKSPSAASNFVCGRSANGWVEWVTPDGRKLGEFRGMDLKKVDVPPVQTIPETPKADEPEHDHARDLKEKTEQMLLNLTAQDSEINVVPRSIHTSVYYQGALIASIYYRVREIRIEMRDIPATHVLYDELKKESLVYQKPSADPRKSPGKYQFFVSAENAETVLIAIILAAQTEQPEKPPESAPKPAREPMLEVSEAVLPAAEPRHETVIREAPAAKPQENSKRIEKKLDYLLGMINALQAEKESTPDEPTEPEVPKYKGFLMEATNGNDPVLMCFGRNVITGLIMRLRLKAIGIDNTERTYRVFFADRDGNRLCSASEVRAVNGEEYTLRFELASGASEKEKIYLIVQGLEAAENEARQMIEFPVKIAFAADFGL